MATTRVASSRMQAAISARPTSSGTPASGPKGSPAVRDHSHSASGTAEAAATAGSRTAVVPAEHEEPDKLGQGQDKEEGAGRDPVVKVARV